MRRRAGVAKSSDARPSIAGHPLPWSIVPYVPPPAKRPELDEGEEADERGNEAFIVDADGYQVHCFYDDTSEGKLWPAVVEHLVMPRETLADLALAEKAAKVAKMRLENERREGDPEALVGRRRAARAGRIAALEDAVLQIADVYTEARATSASDVHRSTYDILTNLGLADRVLGNPGVSP